MLLTCRHLPPWSETWLALVAVDSLLMGEKMERMEVMCDVPVLPGLPEH